MDYVALKSYILGDPSFTQWVNDGVDSLIAKEINNRTSIGYKETEAGIGTILETLGITAGNALLDILKTVPDFRYVWPLVEQGRLRLDSPLVLATLDLLVGTGITLADADKLKAVAQVQKPMFGQTLTHGDVAKALRG